MGEARPSQSGKSAYATIVGIDAISPRHDATQESPGARSSQPWQGLWHGISSDASSIMLTVAGAGTAAKAKVGATVSATLNSTLKSRAQMLDRYGISTKAITPKEP